MATDLILHEKSRWTNPASRRSNAVSACENRDEVALTSLLEAYLRLHSRKQSGISHRTLIRYGHALKPLFDYLWQPQQRHSLLQVGTETLQSFLVVSSGNGALLPLERKERPCRKRD